jgi:L-iditol 2-dehydrogenase
LNADEACLAEPLSVGVYAVRRAQVILGDQVLVIGAGPVGLATAFAAEAQGAAVTLSDISEPRIVAATQAGFSAGTFTGDAALSYDAVFECTGTHDGIKNAQQAVRPGGRLALIGMGQANSMQLNGLDLSIHGITVIGIFRYANSYPSALSLIRRYRERLGIFQGTYVTLGDLPQFLADRSYQNHLKSIVHLT